MTTPDQAAAALVDGSLTAGTLTSEHVGSTVTVRGVTGELRVVAPLSDSRVFLGVQVDGNAYSESLTCEADETIALEEPPFPDALAVDLSQVRELIAICDRLKACEGEVGELKERKRELQNRVLEAMISNGTDRLGVDGRLVHLTTRRYPKMLPKPASEGGGIYGKDDLLPGLRAIGYGHAIKAPEINHQTLGAILRELTEDGQPLPDELASMVTLQEEMEPRVRAARKSR